MSTAVTVYESIRDPLQFIKETGAAIAASGMFGCTGPNQGIVLAMECVAKRLPPLSLAERYHIIEGKLSMKADAMLAAFRQLGGEHKLIQRTPDGAEIELALKKEKHRFRLTWEECQAEPFPYGQGGKLKKNWATPRARMQMMWARVVSDGVRAMAPEVVAGYYTPEELGGEDIEPDAANGSIIDVDHEPAAGGNATSEPSGGQPDVPAGTVPFEPQEESTLERIDDRQVAAAKQLILQAKLTGPNAKALVEKYAGAGNKLADLTPDGAARLNDELQRIIMDRLSAKPTQPDPEGAGTKAVGQPELNGHRPILKKTVDQIRTVARDLERFDPDVQAKLTTMIRKAGKQSVEEISRDDGEKLLQALYKKAAMHEQSTRNKEAASPN